MAKILSPAQGCFGSSPSVPQRKVNGACLPAGRDQVLVHKVNGKERYTYNSKNERVPVPK
ncbi:MAG: hypothetical protein HY399_08210 [Elusimicrobia bacterium]|nr:hypothetical protein [Elusimicrobiota bacterium]